MIQREMAAIQVTHLQMRLLSFIVLLFTVHHKCTIVFHTSKANFLTSHSNNARQKLDKKLCLIQHQSKVSFPMAEEAAPCRRTAPDKTPDFLLNISAAQEGGRGKGLSVSLIIIINLDMKPNDINQNNVHYSIH